MMNLYDYAVFFFTNPKNKEKIQKAFDASFGGGLFKKLCFIFEKDNMEFTQMSAPPIIMRKISEAIMSNFSGILAVSHQQENSLILRDLSNALCEDEEMMEEDENADEIDKILIEHKNFLNDKKMRNEEYILELLISITNIHESKIYYLSVKKLFPQVWKSFTKEEKQYLSYCIKQFLKSFTLNVLQNQKKKMNSEFDSFPNELLEIFQQLEPQIVLGPEYFVKPAEK
jgi:hypothetical protein